jgi:pilus assembly protein CpaC
MTFMHPKTARLLRAALAATVALAALAPSAGSAQIASSAPAAAQALTVSKDKSVAFRLEYPVGEIVVAQPDVLQLVATTDQSFYVRGKALGSTNLLIYDKQHRLAQVIDVRVGYDLESLQSDLALALPGERITAINFAGGILLRGQASSLKVEQRARDIAERYAPKSVSSEVKIKAADQILVEVRIIEANRNSLKDLGVHLNASNSNFSVATGGAPGLLSNQTPQGIISAMGNWHGVSIDATLSALEQKGLVRTLAKPDLIAMSGQEASFLAGGEFPYPVPNGPQQVTIEFKPFGVRLHVTPVLEDNGQIQLKVAPEVSALDMHNQLTFQGITMPSLTTRKAETTVELANGQSFAIAGLFQQDYQNAISQVPFASDIPVLGALFRSTDWQRSESELVIIVTPILTAPADSLDQIHTPVDSKKEAGVVDQFLLGRTFDQPISTPVTAKGPR